MVDWVVEGVSRLLGAVWDAAWTGVSHLLVPLLLVAAAVAALRSSMAVVAKLGVFVVAVVLASTMLFRGGGSGGGDAGGGPSASPHLAVTASARGGWDVRVGEVAGADRYQVVLDGAVVATVRGPGAVHVVPAPVPARSYRPGPVHRFALVARVPGGAGLREQAPVCAPVVVLAARGTWEDARKPQFGQGVGSRGWRTWHYLAEQLGARPAAAGVEPTVVEASGVHYPAAVVALSSASYSHSRDQGKDDLVDRWRAVARDCPDSRVVLFGYSQGADVVASVWQADVDGVDRDAVDAVVLLADPHFNRGWAGQGIALPAGGVWEHQGMLGARPLFADDRVGPVQAWCWPGDPVCQKYYAPRHWHGPAYDCYERFAAQRVAAAVRGPLAAQGWRTPAPRRPTCTPDTSGR